MGRRLAQCAVGFTILLARPPHVSAQHAIRTQAECRHFVSELSSPVNDSTWRLALVSLYDCPKDLGSTLAALWRALPSDSVKRDLLYFASSAVRDDSLYRQVVRQARNPANPDSLRFRALEVLVPMVDSSRLILVREAPGVRFSDTGVTVAIGSSSHPFVRYGANHLPASVPDSILALFKDLSVSDASPLVRRVARRAYEWLTYPR